MIWFLTWLVAVELLGLSVLPLAVRLFRWLPDRGFLFAKPLGVLLVAYGAWILGTFGILRFQQATIAMLMVALGALCWAAWGRETLRRLSGMPATLLVSELAFLLSLAAAALIRAHNPEISGTEKPMDFAFLNALYRTESFPPEDPWMSGHGISYYYFGYLLLATVAKLSGVPAAVGYNLGVALVFGFLVAGSFSLAFNLLTSLGPRWRLSGRLAGALLAPVMIGVMGNLEGGLELLAARGVGDPTFWQWVGVKGLEPAAQPVGWFPTTHWWWWRASRVIPTIKPDGITEFPFFSFLLGDLHPHYTALPWALLAVALAMAALFARAAGKREAGRDWVAVVVPALALGFLLVGNSWDFPTYSGLFWVSVLVPLSASDWTREKLIPRVKGLVLLSLLSVLLYSPFLLGFSSQTKGIGLSTDKTPLASLLILFGPFLFVVGCLLVWRGWSSRKGGMAVSYGVGGRWVAPVLGLGGLLLVGVSPVLGAVSLLVGLLLLAGAAIGPLLAAGGGAQDPALHAAAQRFLLILVVAGLLLILGPEYVFLVDLFGTRMNTVFKFHYQAWLLLGLASASAAVWMVTEIKRCAARWPLAACTALLVGIGLLYPLAATPAKTQGFRLLATLDGASFYQGIRPDDYAAIQWLSRTAQGRPVVLEATGGEYSEYARVSTFSGLPAVLGWAGHEVQWRGRGEEPQRRIQDIDAIYRTADPDGMMALLRKYGVQYVFVGGLEVDRYGQGVLDRFEGRLELAHRQGRVVIYRVPQVAGG
ncbi:MAG: DUF2298 domain-containing protein [Chloroflexota bacterium]